MIKRIFKKQKERERERKAHYLQRKHVTTANLLERKQAKSMNSIFKDDKSYANTNSTNLL